MSNQLDPDELAEQRRLEGALWRAANHAQASSLQQLLDSKRLIKAGRQTQRRLDCGLIEARILDLYRKGPADLVAGILIEELNTMRDLITASE